MQAMVLTSLSHLELQEVPRPQLEEDEVLLRVAACGICGSDIHGYDGSSGRRQPPLIMGHEAAGTIEAVGPAVQDWHVGTRVVVDSTVYCGDCSYCHRGAWTLCQRRRVLGVSCDDYRRDGAFAQFVAVPQRVLHAIPDELAWEHAAMVEPVAVALHAVARAARLGHATESARVVVLGCGMIGLLLIQALRWRGYREICAVDRVVERLDMSVSLGATHTLSGDDPNLIEKIRDRYEGDGADLVFEVVGHPSTVETAIRSTRKGGGVVLVGNLAPLADLPLQDVVTRELSLLGSCAAAGEYPDAIRALASGDISVASLISAVAPLADGPAWFRRLHAGEAGVMKVILQPLREES